MAIRLDHVIVPSHEALTFDFADREQFESHHFCFHVSDDEFDAIFGRIQASGTKYRSRPHGQDDMQINTRLGGKNIYWQDPDGHLRPRAGRGHAERVDRDGGGARLGALHAKIRADVG